MPYIYILECSDGSYYTGSTVDLEKRLAEHQTGIGSNHTAKRLPVKLVYCEECDRVDDAFYREKQVQGWSRKKKQALITGDMNALHTLAVCRNETHHGFDSAQPPASTSAQPPALESVQPPALESVQPPALDSAQPPALDSAQPPASTSAQPPASTSAQPPASPSSPE